MDKTQPHDPMNEDTLQSGRGNGSHHRKPRPSLRSFLLIGGLISCGFFVVAALLLPVAAYGYYQLYGLILPGVHIGGLDLGSMAWQEAYEGLSQVYDIDPEILVTDGNRLWKAKASDFGVAWDLQGALHQTLAIGHGKDISTEAKEMISSFRNGWAIEMPCSFNEEIARTALAEWQRTVNIPPIDAELEIREGEVVIIPPQTGSALDIESTLQSLAADPRSLLVGGGLQFELVPVNPALMDVSVAAAQAERYLGANLEVKTYDPISDEQLSWQVSRQQIADWLRIWKGELAPYVLIDEEHIAAYVDRLNAELGSDRFLKAEEAEIAISNALETGADISLRLYHPRTTYVVQPDETLLEIGWKLGFPYWIILASNPDLDSRPLEAGEELIIPSKDELLPLPVISNKRIVINITRQRLLTYEDGQQLKEYVISTGIAKSPTQPGVFQVRTHELDAYASKWDLYMPHFLGIYEAGPGFMNGIHGLPMLSSGRRLWANVLGRPASYGCIILTLADAEELYNWAEDGVVVEIQR